MFVGLMEDKSLLTIHFCRFSLYFNRWLDLWIFSFPSHATIFILSYSILDVFPHTSISCSKSLQFHLKRYKTPLFSSIHPILVLKSLEFHLKSDNAPLFSSIRPIPVLKSLYLPLKRDNAPHFSLHIHKTAKNTNYPT